MRKWLKISLLAMFIISIGSLLVAGNRAQKNTEIEEPDILIHVDGDNAFLNKEEVIKRLKRKGLIFPGQTKEELHLDSVERFIAAMSEVKQVTVNSFLGGAWKIEMDVRKPIARLQNNFDESYYLDEDGKAMPLSDNHVARVLVVTGDLPDRMSSESYTDIINNDSLISIRKIDDVYRISNYVCNDPLMQSLIGQIHRKSNGDFVLVPIVGGQKIIFGSAYSDEEVQEKFKKLKILYKEALPYEGWNKYTEISLKYDKQIVCKTN